VILIGDSSHCEVALRARKPNPASAAPTSAGMPVGARKRPSCLAA
jgi:hypothetical protein